MPATGYYYSHGYDQGVTSATVSSTAIWTVWNGSSTATSSSVTVPNSEVWTGWNPQFTAQILQDTPEQAQARLRAIAERQEAAIRALGERAAARERAEVLLRENLSPMQLAELDVAGHFHLETITAAGERRRYRIERGRSRNVKQVTADGRIIKTLCAHPAEAVPDADTMLAQKFFLESSEEEFLRVANHS